MTVMNTHLSSRSSSPGGHLTRAAAALALTAFVLGCRDRSNDATLGASSAAAPSASPQAKVVSEPERVTLGQLLSAPERYSGHRVRIAGEPRPGVDTVTTLLPCPPADPCCNSCGSGFALDGQLPLTGRPSAEFGCSGDSCTCAKTCRPFPPHDAGVWTFVGTVEVSPRGPNLRVESWTQEP